MPATKRKRTTGASKPKKRRKVSAAVNKLRDTSIGVGNTVLTTRRASSLLSYGSLKYFASSTPIVKWRLNNPYDPDYDVGGTTAKGWAQLSNIYNKYYVTAVKVTLFVSPSGADGGYACITHYHQDETPPSSITSCLADRNTHIMPLREDGLAASKTIIFDMAKLIGGRASDEDNEGSFGGSSPPSEWRLQVIVFNKGGSTQDCHIGTSLEYNVVCHEPKARSGS